MQQNTDQDMMFAAYSGMNKRNWAVAVPRAERALKLVRTHWVGAEEQVDDSIIPRPWLLCAIIRVGSWGHQWPAAEMPVTGWLLQKDRKTNGHSGSWYISTREADPKWRPPTTHTPPMAWAIHAVVTTNPSVIWQYPVNAVYPKVQLLGPAYILLLSQIWKKVVIGLWWI